MTSTGASPRLLKIRASWKHLNIEFSWLTTLLPRDTRGSRRLSGVLLSIYITLMICFRLKSYLLEVEIASLKLKIICSLPSQPTTRWCRFMCPPSCQDLSISKRLRCLVNPSCQRHSPLWIHQNRPYSSMCLPVLSLKLVMCTCLMVLESSSLQCIFDLLQIYCQHTYYHHLTNYRYQEFYKSTKFVRLDFSQCNQ